MKEFGDISGLYVNAAKSLLFPMGTLAAIGPGDLPNLGLTWELNNVRYLGIKIAHNEEDSNAFNIGRVVEGLKPTIRFWNTPSLSLMGRVALAKMVVLPRCLYVLQGTIYEIPQTYFTTLDKLLTQLLWAGKRVRVGLSTLKRTWEKGGMEVPDLEMYYLAAHLQHAIHWLDEDDNWEKQLIKGTWSLEDLPRVLMMGQKTPVGTPYIVEHTCRLWERVVKRIIGRAPYAPEMQLWTLQPFIKMATQMTVTKWIRGGCRTIGDLHTEGGFVTIREAEELFDLGQGQYIQYARISAIIREIWPSFPVEPPKSSTLNVLHNYAGGKSLISHLYRALRDDRPAPTLRVQQKWETGVGPSD